MPRKKNIQAADEAPVTMPRKKNTKAAADEPITFKAQSSPLLRLPAELRNRIFDLVRHNRVHFKTVMYWSPATDHKRSENNTMRLRTEPWTDDEMSYERASLGHARPKPLTPLFARICKQIYCEEIQAFYANTRFSFDTLLTLRAWLRAVSEANLEMVKTTKLSLKETQGNYFHIPEFTVSGVRVKGGVMSVELLKKEKKKNGSVVFDPTKNGVGGWVVKE